MQMKTTVVWALGSTLIGVAVWVVDWQSLFTSALDYFQTEQRQFHDQLATAMHAIHDQDSWLAGLTLIGVGFFYGIFHAIGPGHGKLIVTGYMLADNSSLRRGIVIVGLASLLQGLVAIAVVLGLFYLLGLARAQTEQAALLLEGISFLLIAVIGLRLLLRGVREAAGLRRQSARHSHEHAHVHHGHSHAHVHEADCGCGHAHMPSAHDVAQARSFGALALLVLSIGIRPCSGAIILLMFACLIGVVGAGVAATMAMSVGTAITTAGLAIAAVGSKEWILRRMQANDRTLAITHASLAIGAGLLIVLVGSLFAFANLQGLLRGEASYGGNQINAAPMMHLPQR